MKDFFKKFSIFNYIYLICAGLIITIGLVISEDKNYFSYVTSLIGVVAFLFSAKGLVIAPVCCSAYYILYAILSISQKFYGEAIVNGLVSLPIAIFTIITWIRNKNKKDVSNVQINRISKKEYLCLIPVIIFGYVGFYFLLKALNTEQLLISTGSTVCCIISCYLLMRRSSFYAIGFLIADSLVISLWTINILNFGFSYLPTLLSICCFFVNDLYGLISWQREKIKQKTQDVSFEND